MKEITFRKKRMAVVLKSALMLALCLSLIVNFFCMAAMAGGEGPYGNIAVTTRPGIGDFPDFSTIINTDGDFTAQEIPMPAGAFTVLWYISLIGLIAGCVAGAALVAAFVIVDFKTKNRSLKQYILQGTAVLAVLLVFVLGGALGLGGAFGKTRTVSDELPELTRSGYVREDFGSTGSISDPIENVVILTDFNHGLQEGYFRSLPQRFGRYWDSTDPLYNYASANPSDMNLKKIRATDECNYWNVYGDSSGKKNGFCETDFRLDIMDSYAYVDTRVYDSLRVVYRGENSGAERVNLEVYAVTKKGVTSEFQEGVRYKLGTFQGESGKAYQIDFNLSSIFPADRPYVSDIVFRTYNKDIGRYEHITNSLYLLELVSKSKTYMNAELDYSDLLSDGTETGKMQMYSEYLGMPFFAVNGAYSPTGFYDKTDKKYKLWFGCGVPDDQGRDNVFYTESDNLQRGWTEQYRIVPEGAGNPAAVDWPLRGAYEPQGYGGDPSVIKIDGVYYMYITALEKPPNNPVNKIYLFTSADGKNFKLKSRIVDVDATGWTLGQTYGAGLPSVVYKDGTYYLYYFTSIASWSEGATDEEKAADANKTGFVVRTSSDGVHFGPAARIGNAGSCVGLDVKYFPEFDLFIGIGDLVYTDTSYNWNTVRFGFSKNGTDFIFFDKPLERPFQDYSAWGNHNPGFLGDEQGHGFTESFIFYGRSCMPWGAEEYDQRQMYFSRVKFAALS